MLTKKFIEKYGLGSLLVLCLFAVGFVMLAVFFVIDFFKICGALCKYLYGGKTGFKQAFILNESDIDKNYYIKNSRAILNKLNNLQKDFNNYKDEKLRNTKLLKNNNYNLCKSFDEIIKYYGEDDKEELISQLYLMADSCKNSHNFDKAIKYYSYIINEKQDEHKAYWNILLCKARCVNNEELINSKTPIGNYNEFNSALSATNNDEKAMDNYINIQRIQSDNLKKLREKKNLIIKKIFIIGLILTIILAVICGLIFMF